MNDESEPNMKSHQTEEAVENAKSHYYDDQASSLNEESREVAFKSDIKLIKPESSKNLLLLRKDTATSA